MSTTITYDFSSPSDYTLSNAVVSGGKASIARTIPLPLSKNSNFGTPSDYTYDNTKIAVASSHAALLSFSNSATFSQNYALSTGFTFTAQYTSISSGLSQVSQQAANESFYAHLNSVINANWTSGSSVTGTSTGTTSFSGGKLNLATNGSVSWASPAALQTGAFRFRVTPNYSGAPSVNQIFMNEGSISVNHNIIECWHSNTGHIKIVINNNAGFAFINADLGLWSQVSGTEYEFELDYDITGGATRLFINGVQFGATQAGTGTRTATTTFATGLDGLNTTYPGTNFSIRGIEVFTTVQHTSGYTAPLALPGDFIYTGDVVTFPLFTPPTSISGITSFNSATVTDVNAPGYVLNGLYWNGSAWVSSNNTYAQSSSAAQVVANIATLPAAATLQVILITNGSNTLQQSASLFSVGYSYSTYSAINPTILLAPGQAINDALLSAITNITATITASGSDAVQFSVSLDGGLTFKYWNGSVWAVSSSYAQSNTLATLVANLSTLPLTTLFQLQAYLHSTDGTTTPQLANVTVSYTDLIYGSGTVKTNSAFTADQVLSMAVTQDIAGSDTILYGMVVNAALMYWNGTAWVASNGTAGQLNPIATIQANLLSLVSVSSLVQIFFRLTSANGLTTPDVDMITATFTLGGLEPAAPNTCLVYGYLLDLSGQPVAGETVTFQLVTPNSATYTETTDFPIDAPQALSVVTDAFGYFAQMLIWQSEFEGAPKFVSVTFKKGKQAINLTAIGGPLQIAVPDAVSFNITGLLAG